MWLLEPNVTQELRAKFKHATAPTAAQLEQFSAHMMALDARSDAPRNFKVAGDVAEISINGVLTKKPDFFLWFFGFSNTTYEEIEASLSLAASDPAIKRVVFNINSPGGSVDGLFDAIAAMDAFPKPKSVKASLAASAAYALASLGGKIEATNAAATFGSIGVVVEYFIDEDTVEITSTEAPDKRPDLTTDEGKAVVREYLDALHDLFADAIARGRGTTKASVNETFGRGRVFVAGDAKKLKMIDKIAKPALRAVAVEVATGESAEATEPSAPEPPTAAPIAAQSKGHKHMDLQTLKAQHPEVFAAAFAEGKAAGEAAAKEDTLKTERSRVNAFLIAGEKSGDMKSAIEAVRSGDEMTMEHMTKFMFAGRNNKDIEDRQIETDAAADAVDGADNSSEPKDLGDSVAELMAASRGKK